MNTMKMQPHLEIEEKCRNFVKWLFTKRPLYIVFNLSLDHKNQWKDLALIETNKNSIVYLFFIIVYSSTVNMSVTSL